MFYYFFLISSVDEFVTKLHMRDLYLPQPHTFTLLVIGNAARRRICLAPPPKNKWRVATPAEIVWRQPQRCRRLGGVVWITPTDGIRPTGQNYLVVSSGVLRCDRALKLDWRINDMSSTQYY